MTTETFDTDSFDSATYSIIFKFTGSAQDELRYFGNFTGFDLFVNFDGEVEQVFDEHSNPDELEAVFDRVAVTALAASVDSFEPEEQRESFIRTIGTVRADALYRLI